MRYAACLEQHFDPVTGTCAQIVFVDSPTLLPPMSVQEGLQISAAIVAVLGVALCIRLVARIGWKVG